MSLAEILLARADALSRALATLTFAPPVTHVYDPLRYARAPHAAYLRRYANTPKRVLFVGMNPGPFGMAQTGVPFGEIAAVRDWLGVTGEVGKPAHEHPKRPVVGFACARSEVSGARLWGLWRARFGSAERFFAHAFVANYCPLVFMEASGRNLTPDKLPRAERAAVFGPCDAHLAAMVDTLTPEWLVGVGQFATERARGVAGARCKIGTMPHPSPASPQANRDFAGQALAALAAQGVPL